MRVGPALLGPIVHPLYEKVGMVNDGIGSDNVMRPYFAVRHDLWSEQSCLVGLYTCSVALSLCWMRFPGKQLRQAERLNPLLESQVSLSWPHSGLMSQDQLDEFRSRIPNGVTCNRNPASRDFVSDGWIHTPSCEGLAHDESWHLKA